MRNVLLVAASLSLLGGCGQAAESANESFDTDFRASCVNSAYAKGVEEPLAREICDCALTRINEKFSAAEKLSASNDKLMPIMNECVTSVVKKNG